MFTYAASKNVKVIKESPCNKDVVLPKDLWVDTIFTSPPYYKLKKYGNFPCRLQMIPPDRIKWYQGLFFSLLIVLSEGIQLVKTDRIFFDSETGFISTPAIG